jgi:predicted RNA methylase
LCGGTCAELEQASAGEIRLVSLCAGQGRDVIGVLAGHPRRDDVRARLVELDADNVAAARHAAQAAGLDSVEILQADAGSTDASVGAVPARIVVACGIFGNITHADIQATVAALPRLCAPSALVVWTRHRKAPDLTPTIRSWFSDAGFREEAFDISQDGFMSVGAHRLEGEPSVLTPGQRLFTFEAARAA